MLGDLKERLAQTPALLPVGRVESVLGQSIRVTLAGARIGDVVWVRRRGQALRAEVVGLSGGQAIVMPLGEVRGVGVDDPVEATGQELEVRVSEQLLGRVLSGLGEPLDGRGPLGEGRFYPVDAPAPPVLSRQPVRQVLATGLRVVDGLMTLGQGQRIGLFSAAGVGKSSLLGAVARNAEADIVVVALVGERGREVTEFIEKNLGEPGMKKTVLVVATSDAPALERLRAAQVATSIAEFFRDQGRRVLLLVDSMTRLARAQREVGLAAGEPPVRRGFPPSVFALMPRLVERAGAMRHGSITAVYAVLVEGADLDEPIADELRGLLDGHIVLERALAQRGQYPAVDVLGSLSRVMDGIVTERHRTGAQRFRQLLSAYEAKRELVGLGAYVKGADPLLDVALGKLGAMEAFLRQPAGERCAWETMMERLASIG